MSSSKFPSNSALGLNLAALEARAPAIYIPPSLQESAFKALVEKITAFEATLKDTEAVGTLLASFGQSILLNIRSVSQAGQFICMEGITSDGSEASLVQHYTQTSMLLLKVKTEEPRRPIGFTTE